MTLALKLRAEEWEEFELMEMGKKVVRREKPWCKEQ